MKCKLCNFESDNVGILNNHIRWVHKRAIKTCPLCGESYNKIRQHRATCSAVPHGPHRLTDAEKKHLSEVQKQLYKEHPEKYFRGKTSKPCEYLKSKLRELGYSFISEFQPLSERCFSIDICFPQWKFGIEVNGNFHYDENFKLKPYYQERHDLIESDGWVLWEVPYNLCYKDEFILELCRQMDAKLSPNQLLCKFESCQLYKDFIKKEEMKKQKKLQRDQLKESLVLNSQITKQGIPSCNVLSNSEWESRKSKILESNIDLTKFGWVNKVCKATGLSKHQVEDTVKKFNMDVYKRKI